MKYFFPAILLFLSVKLFSLHEVKQTQKIVITNSFDSLEVFVSITSHDLTTFTNVKTVINSLPGVNYLAYCSNHAVFMVYIDNSVYASKNDFMDQLLKLLPQYASILNLKNGNFLNFVTDCITLEEAEAAAIKNKFGN